MFLSKTSIRLANWLPSFKTFKNSHTAKPKMFDFHHNNPDHITNPKQKPRSGLQKKLKKWAPDCPPAFNCSYSKMMNIIEREEIEKFVSQPNFSKEDVSLGDRVKVDYLQSITSGVSNVYEGVVLGVAKEGKLTYTFTILTRVEGEMVVIRFPFFSPLIKSIEVVSKGAGFREGQKQIYYFNKIRKIGQRAALLLKGTKESLNQHKKQRQALKKEIKEKMAVFEEQSEDEFEGLDI